MHSPMNILVPTDFSESADAAIEYAVELAGRLDATVHLLHVVTFPALGVPELAIAQANALMQSAVREATERVERIAKALRTKVTIGSVRVETGDVREAIDHVAEQIEADLIVMGTHGRRGLSRLFLGSVAETVVRTAPCPVLTLREAA